jgi:hypothetical protein
MNLQGGEREMKTYTIEKKMSGTGTIHDLASESRDRDIRFPGGCKYAVVLAAYYGGKGYTTHKTAEAAIAKSKQVSCYSHAIIDDEGNRYTVKPGYYQDELVRD